MFLDTSILFNHTQLNVSFFCVLDPIIIFNYTKFSQLGSNRVFCMHSTRQPIVIHVRTYSCSTRIRANAYRSVLSDVRNTIVVTQPGRQPDKEQLGQETSFYSFYTLKYTLYFLYFFITLCEHNNHKIGCTCCKLKKKRNPLRVVQLFLTNRSSNKFV